MAISLLGNLPTPSTNYASLTKAAPAAQPLAQSVKTGLPVAGSINGSTVSAPQIGPSSPASLGIKAISPTTNVAAVPTTLPKSQAAAPVDTSSFTPQQEALFSQAASLGSGVQTQSGEVGGAPSPVATNPPVQNNTGYTYNASGQLIPNTNAAAGTAGSADPTAAAPAPAANTASTTGTTGAPYSTTNPVSQSGLLAQAANLSSAPSADYTAQQAQANQYNRELQQSQANEAQSIANIEGTPLPMNFAQGAENVVRNQYLQQQQGLATAYQGASTLLGAANTQQGQEQSGLLSAAGQTAPVTQFGQLTNPLTGQVISPAGGNPQLNTAVQQAVQLIQNGATQADAIATSGLSNFGLPGSQALTAALQQGTGGTYNPTAQNAVSAANAATGTNLGTQAAMLQPSLTGLTQTGQQIQSLLTNGAANGLNALQPNWANTAIQTLQSTLGNNANVSSLAAMVSDAQGYIGQILQSQDGMTPTAATSAAASLNLMNLSPNALSTVLSNISNLGQIRIGTAQQGASGALGSAAGSLYQGQSANVNPNASVNTQTNVASGLSPGEQAAAGTFLGAIDGIISFGESLFGKIANGAAAGEGASVATGGSGIVPGAAAAVLTPIP